MKKTLKCIPIKVWDGMSMESVEVTPRKLGGRCTANDNSSREDNKSEILN